MENWSNDQGENYLRHNAASTIHGLASCHVLTEFSKVCCSVTVGQYLIKTALMILKLIFHYGATGIRTKHLILFTQEWMDGHIFKKVKSWFSSQSCLSPALILNHRDGSLTPSSPSLPIASESVTKQERTEKLFIVEIGYWQHVEQRQLDMFEGMESPSLDYEI